MAETRVSNKEIADSLRILGFLPKDQPVDVAGAQSSAFPIRLGVRGVTDAQFAKAKAFAVSMKDRGGIPADVLDEWERTSIGTAAQKKNPNWAYDQFVTIGEQKLGGQGGQKLTNFRSGLSQYRAANPKGATPFDLDVGPASIQGPRVGGTSAPKSLPAKPTKATAKTPQTGTQAPASDAPGGPGAPGAPGSLVPGVAGAPGLEPPKLPKNEAEVKAYINEHYSQWAYLQDVPEVWEVVRNSARGGLSADKTLGALQQTGWWNKTETSARLWMESKATLGTAEINDQIGKKARELNQAAVASGITIPPEELNAMAEDALRFDWDPIETKQALGRFFKYDPDKLMGSALTTQQELKQASRDWLVPLDDATLAKWTTQVVNGEIDTEYVNGYLKQQAQSLFPQLADPIARGIAPGQWMQPYVSVAAQTLGVNPDTIDLRESKWMRSINQVDDKGARTAMNLADWEDLLKTDETYGWDKTDSGREHGATMARKLAGMFRGNA